MGQLKEYTGYSEKNTFPKEDNIMKFPIGFRSESPAAPTPDYNEANKSVASKPVKSLVDIRCLACQIASPVDTPKAFAL